MNQKKLKMLFAFCLCFLFYSIAFAQDVSNPQNPKDDVGKGHNEALDYLKSNLSANDLRDANKKKTKLAQFAVSKNVGVTSEQVLSALNDPNFVQFLQSSNHVTFVANLYQTSNEFNTFFADIDKISKEAIATTEAKLMENVGRVKALETQILRSALVAKEKDALLYSSSVLRYSLKYWYVESKNPNSPWSHVINAHNPSADDAGGAALGQFWGGTLGGLAGYFIGGYLMSSYASSHPLD